MSWTTASTGALFSMIPVTPSIASFRLRVIFCSAWIVEQS
jgi:hypothetical protein